MRKIQYSIDKISKLYTFSWIGVLGILLVTAIGYYLTKNLVISEIILLLATGLWWLVADYFRVKITLDAILSLSTAKKQ